MLCFFLCTADMAAEELFYSFFSRGFPTQGNAFMGQRTRTYRTADFGTNNQNVSFQHSIIGPFSFLTSIFMHSMDWPKKNYFNWLHSYAFICTAALCSFVLIVQLSFLWYIWMFLFIVLSDWMKAHQWSFYSSCVSFSRILIGV